VVTHPLVQLPPERVGDVGAFVDDVVRLTWVGTQVVQLSLAAVYDPTAPTE
jgi:hypothetical protein